MLASQSPRRLELLQQIGVEPLVRPADIDESVTTGEAPAAYVQRMAVEKAKALPDSNHIIIGADTSVVVNDRILGKPADQSSFLEMMRLLSDNRHQVMTAVACRCGESIVHKLSVTAVEFRELSSREIHAYWQTGEPADKAGGYAIQGYAAAFVRSLTGSYSGVMGLPLFETSELLSAMSAGDAA